MIKFTVEPEAEKEKEHEIRVKVEVNTVGNMLFLARGSSRWVTVAWISNTDGEIIFPQCAIDERKSLPGIAFRENNRMKIRSLQ